MIECSDGTLYIGISNDVHERIRKHNEGKGAKYTRGRRPVRLLASWEVKNRGEATKLEMKLKKLDKISKLQLIKKERS